MRVYEIKLPVTDNAGKDTVIARMEWEHFTAIRVGGYTRGAEQSGAWLDKGKLYIDKVIPYEVACAPEDWDYLVKLAFDFFPDQLAIYTADKGEADIRARAA